MTLLRFRLQESLKRLLCDFGKLQRTKGVNLWRLNKFFVTLLAVAIAVAFGFVDNAAAASKKKISYEEAYARCGIELPLLGFSVGLLLSTPRCLLIGLTR